MSSLYDIKNASGSKQNVSLIHLDLCAVDKSYVHRVDVSAVCVRVLNTLLWFHGCFNLITHVNISSSNMLLYLHKTIWNLEQNINAIKHVTASIYSLSYTVVLSFGSRVRRLSTLSRVASLRRPIMPWLIVLPVERKIGGLVLAASFQKMWNDTTCCYPARHSALWG